MSSDENAAEQQLVAEVLQANLWTDSNTLQPKKIFPVAQALRVSSSDTVRQPASQPASARCGCSAFLQAAKTRRRRGELHCTVRDCFLLLTGAAERERSFFYKAQSISTQSIFHAQINTANSCQKQCLKKKSHPDNCCCETQERLTGSQFKQSTDFTSFSTSASFKKTAPTLIELQQTLEMCSI